MIPNSTWLGARGRQAVGLITGLALLLLACAPATAGTLEDVRKRGHLACGVAEGPLGFSYVDDRGAWSGLDVDFCAGLAAAIFGRKDAVKYRALTAADRFSALKAGDVDVLGRSATWTLSRDMDLGARFVAPLFHDGLGLLVRRSQGVSSALELSGATICISAGGPAQPHLEEYFTHRGMKINAIVFEKWEDAIRAFQNKRCTALSADITALALVRSTIGSADEHQILPEIMSKEPLGPVVRLGDDRWFGIVRWVLFAMITAEEHAVTTANVDVARTNSHLVEVRRLLGTDGDLGASLGLSRDWAYRVIKSVGNYGEMFERNLGMRSTLRLERGANNLWSKGGLLHSPPFR